jgi:DNA-binding NarL/FixJ family response regulator
MANPTKVLVVDDEPHVRTYVTMLVQSVLTDCEISQAGDEASALAQFASVRPSLVLLDINLVGGSGLRVLEGIRRQDAEVVVIMLTAVSVRHVIDEAMAKGADGYILKEASHEEMAASLREALEDSNEESAGSVAP